MSSTTNVFDTQAPSLAVSVDLFLEQCHGLLHELEEFQDFLVEQKKEHTVELRQFRNSINSELKSLQKVLIPSSTKKQYMLNLW